MDFDQLATKFLPPFVITHKAWWKLSKNILHAPFLNLITNDKKNLIAIQEFKFLEWQTKPIFGHHSYGNQNTFGHQQYDDQN